MSSSDDDWGTEADDKVTPEPAKKKTPQPAEKKVEEPKKGEELQTSIINGKLDESDWMEDKSSKEENGDILGDLPPSKKSKHQETFLNANSHNTSIFGGSVLGKQLEPDVFDTSCWADEDDKKKKSEQKEGKGRGGRGNRGNREEKKQKQKDEEEEKPKRGNRGNREEKQEGSWASQNDQPNFRKKRQFQQYQPRSDNYRGNRGNYRGGNYNNNYNNYNNNNSYNNNRDYNNNNYNRGRQYRQKREDEEGGNDGQSNYRGNRRFDNRNQGYQGGYNRNRDDNYNNYNRNRDDNFGRNDNYRNRDDNYNNRNRDDNYHNRNWDDGQNNRNNNYQNQNQPPPKVEEVKVEAKPEPKVEKKETTQQIQPKGRKCWPQSSLSILNSKIVLTARQLSDFRCKLLVFPYSTIQMEFYPGNVVNSSSVDYRKKIMQKGAEIEVPGSVYLQKAVQVYQFEAIAFVKIDKSQIEESLRKGIIEVLRNVEKIQKPITLETLVFPICEELGDPSWVISPFLKQLEYCRRTKEVWITTINGPTYMKAANAFNSHIQKLFQKNQIFLN